MTIDGTNNADANLPLASLPKTALQAIYHAVTGKTENLSRTLSGNVVITGRDVDRLYEMLLDQLDIHQKVIAPTVTVVVKQKQSKSVTYSSWERYTALRTNNHDVTSELLLKLEFVIQVPNTPTPQRCVVNVNMDSSLPVIQGQSKSYDQEALGFLLMLRRDWQTVEISIDFVDFLIAKSFSGAVEEWFSTLKKTPVKKFNEAVLRSFETIRTLMFQVGRVGMAFFIGAYIWFAPKEVTVAQAALASSVGLLLWVLFAVVHAPISKWLFRRLQLNVVPSVILLTDADERVYGEVTASLNSPVITIGAVIFSVVMSVVVNVGSSFIYAYMTAK